MIGCHSEMPRCSVPKLSQITLSVLEVSMSAELASARAVTARVPDAVEKLTMRMLSPLEGEALNLVL